MLGSREGPRGNSDSPALFMQLQRPADIGGHFPYGQGARLPGGFPSAGLSMNNHPSIRESQTAVGDGGHGIAGCRDLTRIIGRDRRNRSLQNLCGSAGKLRLASAASLIVTVGADVTQTASSDSRSEIAGSRRFYWNLLIFQTASFASDHFAEHMPKRDLVPAVSATDASRSSGKTSIGP
jgi:hypothetical protein